MRPAQAMPAVKSSELAAASSLGRTSVEFKPLVVTRSIAGQFCPFQFRLKFFNDLTLQAIAKILGYRMSDIGVKPRSSLRIDGEPVASFETLTERVGRRGPGEKIELEIERVQPGGEPQRFKKTVELGGWE